MKIPVLIVNLDRDEERFVRTVTQLQRYPILSPLRLSAFPGRILPDHVCHILTGNAWSHEHKGTLGCFISHVSAWETVARDEAANFTLVVEDNAEFSNCELLANLVLPPNCDLAFCNSRTAYPGQGRDPHSVLFRSVDRVPAFVESHGHAVGTDGYILTPRGARKLIEFVTADRLFSHVDLRMLAYGINPLTYPSPDEFSKAAKTIFEFRRTFDKKHYINAYSMVPYLTHRPLQLPSTRVVEDLSGKQSAPIGTNDVPNLTSFLRNTKP